MTIKKINCLVLLICCFCFCYSQKDTLKKHISVSIEHDVFILTSSIYSNSKQNKNAASYDRTMFLLGGVNVCLNTSKKIKKTLFIDYQYYQHNVTYDKPNFIFALDVSYDKKISVQQEKYLYFTTGMNFMFTNKGKLSGFFTSIGIGAGKYTVRGDGYLYDTKTGWCNSIDLGYVIAYKHFYIKPFVGLLSIFNFKEFRDYNDGRTITDGNLNYYSQNNPDKSNLYKSSYSPAPAQIQIKYRYLGLTNATFLPRGLLCVGFTF